MTAMQMLLIVAAIVGVWASICAAALLHDRRTSGVSRLEDQAHGDHTLMESVTGKGGGVEGK